MNRIAASLPFARHWITVVIFAATVATLCTAQQTSPSPESKPAETEKNAAQIELLETKYRFESDGDSRKEVHTRVRINNELGARQFARLNFDFNRSFQSVEIPLVRITHASGGIADILPSAITDNPSPAVVNAPAYQEVRVKSIRILGLQPGDLLEYRVITTTTHHPLAPDFWLDHTFDRTGVVTEENFELNLAKSKKLRIRINPTTPESSLENSYENGQPRANYVWKQANATAKHKENDDTSAEPDISLTTFDTWEALSKKLADLLQPPNKESGGWVIGQKVSQKAAELTQGANSGMEKIEKLYDFVSKKIATVDLPLGSTEFKTRTDDEILDSGFANAEDKFKLLAALARPYSHPPSAYLTSNSEFAKNQLPRPSPFTHVLTEISTDEKHQVWLDPSLQVAPFGMIPFAFRDKMAFALDNIPAEDLLMELWEKVPAAPPYESSQKVTIEANISHEGVLTAKVRYYLRGDNELLLRVAFHRTPKEKWKEVAQLLAVSDGFRGQISNAIASDPYATKELFTVEYEISQPKFVDWSKKPVRVPALLPVPGLPDAASSSQGSPSKKSIDLGTPLDIELNATVQLPEGTTAQAPTGTSVERDYATFSSKYSAEENTLRATRKLHFILREIPAARAADWNAFLHAVQSDQSQLFTLQPSTNR